MELKIYSVYDHKSAAYGRPFFANARGQALRDVTDAVNDPQSPLCRHSKDFALFELGSFDDATAEMQLHNPPQLVSQLAELKEAAPAAGKKLKEA